MGKLKNDDLTERKQDEDEELRLTSDLTLQQKVWRAVKAVIKSALPLILYMLLPGILIALASVLLGGRQNEEEFAAQSSNLYTAMGIILTIYLLYKSSKKKGKKFTEEITLSFHKKDVLLLVMSFVFGVCAAIGISSVITLIPFPQFLIDSYDSTSGAIYSGYDMMLIIICQVILAPFAEETVFRGYMLNRLLPTFGERVSIIIITVIFALCHISGIWVLYAALMGYILTKVAIIKDNILFSIVMHAGFNFPAFLNYIILNNEEANDLLYGSKLFIAIYGIIAICVAVLIYRGYKKKENELC